MILDLVLGLNALIWITVLIMPFFGFVVGYKKRGDLLARAQLILLSLVVLLLTLEVSLSVTLDVSTYPALSMLQGYRLWLVVGATGSAVLAWGLFFLARRLRDRLRRT